MCIGHTIRQHKKILDFFLQNRLHSFHIKRNICRAHTVTSNIIFHILFNEIFDVANIIFMKMMWSILDASCMKEIV